MVWYRMKKRLTIVYTGNGKGKSTAAFGLLFRAKGHQLRCGVLQFIKSKPEHWGEYKMAKSLDIPWENYGCGFTWKQEDPGPTIAEVKEGWNRAQEWIESGNFDLIILDELTYPLIEKWLDLSLVVSYLQALPAAAPHIVITGRNAPEELIACADTAARIQNIHHHFDIKKTAAQKGIEF